MLHHLVMRKSGIYKVLFLLQIIFQSSSYVFRMDVKHSVASEYPFFFRDVVIAYFTGKLEYALKQPAMNGCQTYY